MANVHLLSAAPRDSDDPKAFLDLEQMQESARADRFGEHRVVDDPGEADVILFVETSTAAGAYFERVRSHPVHREFRSSSYLFSSTDKVVPFLPGVYASIERRAYRPAWTRSGHYLGVKEQGDLRYDSGHSPTRLFSFVGRAGMHPVRRRIVGLGHQDAVLIDSDAEAAAVKRGERPPVSEREFVGRYVASIMDCAFVLCPRGAGTATFRLFETMMLGRVPVILSDQWVPPEGPQWESFSLRVAEDEVDTIPARLETRASDAGTMGEAARAAWLDWFSAATGFHRTIEACLDLARFAPARAGTRRFAPHAQMLRPYHGARWAAKRLDRARALARSVTLRGS